MQDRPVGGHGGLPYATGDVTQVRNCHFPIIIKHLMATTQDFTNHTEPLLLFQHILFHLYFCSVQ